MTALKEEMPSMFGKEKKKSELIKNLGDIFRRIQMQHEISPGDFPNLQRMQENLQYHDFSKFNPLRPKLIEKVDQMLNYDIARLMAMLPQEFEDKEDEQTVKGGVFNSAKGDFNPFAAGAAEGFNLGAGSSQWVVESTQSKDKIWIQWTERSTVLLPNVKWSNPNCQRMPLPRSGPCPILIKMDN